MRGTIGADDVSVLPECEVEMGDKELVSTVDVGDECQIEEYPTIQLTLLLPSEVAKQGYFLSLHLKNGEETLDIKLTWAQCKRLFKTFEWFAKKKHIIGVK